MNKYEAAKIIEQYSKDGDTINIANHPAFYKFHIVIACWAIKKAQRKVFKNVKRKIGELIIDPNKDTHSMIKFSKGSINKYILNDNSVKVGDKYKVNKIFKKEIWSKDFSVEPPVATYIPTEEYALDDITVYRPRKRILSESDIKKMLHATLPIIDTKYDYGQLVNILVNQILGYPYDEKVKWFDLGSKRKVCSVGVAVVYQKLRKVLESEGIIIERLFSKLNKANWKDDFIKEFNELGRWNVENTYPAMFGITDTHFDNEFELILKMNKGKIQYSKN